MKVEKTERGFSIIQAIDTYGCSYSLQTSSFATKECVWLGCDLPGARMHLTRDQVRDLLPHLQAFVETGDIEV